MPIMLLEVQQVPRAFLLFELKLYWSGSQWGSGMYERDSVTADTFLQRMLKEKITSQERRGKLITQKLAWTSGLIAAGWIRNIPNSPFDLAFMLYIAPFIAILFDMYIAGESYGIKRMGVFIREYVQNTFDSEWERFVGPKRDMFSWYARPMGSSIVVLASALGIWLASHGLANNRLTNNWHEKTAPPPFSLIGFVIWLGVLMFVLRFLHVHDELRLQRLSKHSACQQLRELTYWKRSREFLLKFFWLDALLRASRNPFIRHEHAEE